MEKQYTNFISLGYFCEVAQDLEKLGLRNFSSPFDWGISYFPSVIEALDNRFDGFMEYENLSQSIETRKHYYDERYHFYSFHDFTEYESLEDQYPEVKEKFRRRIARFLKAIESPTLFVRYISIEELDKNGKSEELNWIEQNYPYIMSVLRKYNPDNDIVFIGDETVHSDSVKIYHVPRDKHDSVSRSPIYNNKELFPLLSRIDFPGKKANQKRYLKKQIKKKAGLGKKAVTKVYGKLFLKEYEHSKVYDVPGK